MKKTLLYIFFLVSLSLCAQDGINYQGAATDANGDELISQNITIRASILSTSANGNLEWEETHSATTDQFGLFNVVIGQGTNTTNGATANFDDMDWGSGNHFLKIEMDATGGTNYAIIGTTQMRSVPYALYAKSAGIDSTMLANMIASSGGGSSNSATNATIDSLSQVVSILDSTLTTLISYFGCTDSTAINYDPAAIADDGSCTAPSLAIGDTYKGGIVFYLDGNGGGLIAAPSDIDNAIWGCSGTNIGVYGTAIGTGVQNTIDIYNSTYSTCLAADNAVSLCVNLTLPSYGGGYDDWVLPSLDELAQMFLIQTQLGLANAWYWSSSEINSTLAFVRNETQHSSASKISGYKIRPIRAF